MTDYSQYGTCISHNYNSCLHQKEEETSTEKRKTSTDFIAELDSRGKSNGTLRIVSHVVSTPKLINGIPNNGSKPIFHYDRKTTLRNVRSFDGIKNHFFQVSGQSIDPASSKRGLPDISDPREPDVSEFRS